VEGSGIASDTTTLSIPQLSFERACIPDPEKLNETEFAVCGKVTLRR
jgi:hypothetical protein